MDETDIELGHLFTLHETIEEWPSEIMVKIAYNMGSEYVVYVTLKSLGVEDRDYIMRWLPHPIVPDASWQFISTADGAPALPKDLKELEESISELIIEIDINNS